MPWSTDGLVMRILLSICHVDIVALELTPFMGRDCCVLWCYRRGWIVRWRRLVIHWPCRKWCLMRIRPRRPLKDIGAPARSLRASVVRANHCAQISLNPSVIQFCSFLRNRMWHLFPFERLYCLFPGCNSLKLTANQPPHGDNVLPSMGYFKSLNIAKSSDCIVHVWIWAPTFLWVYLLL